MVMHQAQFARLDLFRAATLAGKKPPQEYSKQSTGVPAIGSDRV
jgi:hypothetical protein